LKATGFTLNSRHFILYLLATGIALNLFIPPFQNPDEPQHFGMILTYYNDEFEESDVEKEIIKLMDKHRWWTFVGMGRPSQRLQGLSQISMFKFTTFKAVLVNRVFYHRSLAAVLRLLPRFNSLTLYYLCRLCSLIFFSIAIFLAYLTFNKLSKGGINGTLYGFFFMLFLPQLLIISISVNSDSLVILLGCLFFYSSFSLVLEKFNYFHFGVVVMCSLAGALADKSSLYLIPLTLVLLILSIKNKKLVQSIMVISVAILLAGPWIFWYFPVSIFNIVRIAKKTLSLDPITTWSFLSSGDFNQRFFFVMTDSFLLKFGWMSYLANKATYYIWRLFLVFSGLGILLYPLIQSLKSKIHPDERKNNSTQKRLFILSVSGILLQLGAIWIFYGGKGVMAQGRHLFSLLIPFSFLFILGLISLFDLVHAKMSSAVLAAFVLVEFFFFNFVIWFYIVPIFHLAIKSPHPGI